MAKAKETNKEAGSLMAVLQKRFENHMHRHEGISWNAVSEILKSNAALVKIIDEMEATGGEPDVVVFPSRPKEMYYVDCSPESPSGRRSICYDKAALDARKENKPKHSAMAMAAEIGVEILDENDYRELQQIGKFDLKTSSWILTPDAIRKHGGAIFCDRRYDHTFTYHNGAESYYAARGFRGKKLVS